MFRIEIREKKKKIKNVQDREEKKIKNVQDRDKREEKNNLSRRIIYSC